MGLLFYSVVPEIRTRLSLPDDDDDLLTPHRLPIVAHPCFRSTSLFSPRSMFT